MMTSSGARLTTAVALLVLVAIIWNAFTTPQQWDATRIVGFALAVVFFFLLFLARLQLGDSFSIAPEARKLVTTGIYSKVRHPVYTFGLLALIGAATYFRSWPAFAVILIIIPIQFARAQAEEKILTERFGDEYLSYKNKTWF